MSRFSSHRGSHKCQEGYILPMVLVLFAIGILLIAPTLGHGQTSLKATSVTEAKAQELHAADAGIERGILALKHKEASPVDFDLNESEVVVTSSDTGQLTDEGIPIYHIQSTARSSESSLTTIDTLVSGLAFKDLEEDLPGLQMNKNNITGGEVPTGELYVMNSDVDNVSGGFTINGTLIFHGTVDNFTGNSLIGGTVVFCGHVTEFTGSTDSSGSAIFCGQDPEKDPLVYGGSSSTEFELIVVGDLNIKGAANLDGNTVVFGNIGPDTGQAVDISGNVCCTGSIDPQVIVSGTVDDECGDSSDYCYRCSSDYGRYEILSYDVS
ncbi:MAG: hypothetical protein JXA58_05285 [Dehalococcoidia bacterium]|nr:hypothetical protein [Dehalococcoidia bacterium]